MKYLLDTDHISIFQTKSGAEYAALAARLAQEQQSDVAFSIVSMHEQTLGLHTYLARARTPANLARGYWMLSRLFGDYKAFAVLPFDAAAARVLANLLAQRLRVAAMDLRIAAIALSQGLVLLTRNVRDFGKVPGLVIENWTV